ncbi:hypothetical protein OSB04_030613 [Centaurea solstitialis]|uniref:cyclin-dependent kinase n=1 Tax=Centaurea solstitialis TaxID=347529 RepID=A0AA38SKL7_9ASTR|nr:hypothetical protein OSB04_030613 [Centaurea solstitialis]
MSNFSSNNKISSSADIIKKQEKQSSFLQYIFVQQAPKVTTVDRLDMSLFCCLEFKNNLREFIFSGMMDKAWTDKAWTTAKEQMAKALGDKALMDKVRYDIKVAEHIGGGSYADVYKVREKNTNKTVAVKKIHLKNTSQGIPSNAAREISVLTERDHENIVRYIDYIENYVQEIKIFFLINSIKNRKIHSLFKVRYN